VATYVLRMNWPLPYIVLALSRALGVRLPCFVSRSRYPRFIRIGNGKLECVHYNPDSKGSLIALSLGLKLELRFRRGTRTLRDSVHPQSKKRPMAGNGK